MLVIGQVAISIILIVLVLIQERGEGLGALFGGGGGGTPYHTRRGLEKVIFWSTIISAVIFAVLAIINLFII
ncbi:MAG: preprotein translocase subunit SecG [Patescibacteria group bacterium]|nr:preprotein translocase subunit SecG [Patescibacteria group bacterium]